MSAKSARFAKPGTVEPHVPVATVQPSTCGVCGHCIGRTAESDPVHAVPRSCIWKCGTVLPPFRFECEPCAAVQAERRERERQARLANSQPEPVSNVVPLPDRQRTNDGDNEPNPLRKARFNEAVAYIRSYTGTWGFILDLRADTRWDTKWFRLSDKQVDVVLRAKARDAERVVERVRNQTGRDLTVLPYGRTYAAVTNESGETTFLIFDRPTETDRFRQPNKWHGWVFVKQQLGPNENRLGAQRPGETYVGQWPNLIDKVLADPLEAVARYGRELGICGVCALPLTNAESRESGIGPVCRSRLAA